MVRSGDGEFDAAKTDMYREELGQAPITSQSNKTSDPETYCQNIVDIQTPFLAANQPLLVTGQSPMATVGDNLLTFMASRLSTSFTSLACQHYGLTNPVMVRRNGAGVVVAATFNTSAARLQTATATAQAPETPGADSARPRSARADERVREVSMVTSSQTMPVQDEDERRERTDAENEASTGDAGQACLPRPPGGTSASGSRSSRRRSSSRRGSVSAAAGLIGLGNTVILTAIPRPATVNTTFIEDDDGTAADNQENILQATALGMVHVLSGGTSVGIGLVLTESGKVLTTYQPGAGAANLAAEYVVSGMIFKAKVIGTDAAAGLALLQLEGAHGRAVLDRHGRELGHDRQEYGSLPAVLLSRARPGLRHRGRHHRPAEGADHRCRHPGHPGYDRHRRRHHPERADGVGAAVRAAVGRSAARWSA